MNPNAQMQIKTDAISIAIQYNPSTLRSIERPVDGAGLIAIQSYISEILDSFPAHNKTFVLEIDNFFESNV